MLTWDFPYIIADSYGSTIQKGFIEAPGEATVENRKEMFSDVDDYVSGYIVIERARVGEFKRFYEFDTRGGTIPFMYYDETAGIERVTFFTEVPQISTKSNHFKVTLAFRMEHIPVEGVPAPPPTPRSTENGLDRVTEDNEIRVTE